MNVKKLLKFLIIGMVFITGISIWYGLRVSQERESERELFRKALYASTMYFAVREERTFLCNVLLEMGANRRNLDLVQFTEIAFVHSAEHATQFEEYVLVAWPGETIYASDGSVRVRGTQARIDVLNEGIHQAFPDVDFRDYGLQENEITINGVVDDWEIVEQIVLLYGGP
jgi:hypothetical protein